MAYYSQTLHLCRVTEQGWQETKKEPPRLQLVFRVQVLAEISYDENGEAIFTDVPPSQYDQNVFLLIDPENETVMDFAAKKLRYAGFEGTSFTELNLVGKQIRCFNQHWIRDGKVYDSFQLALPPIEQRPVETLDAKKARKLDALFGKRLKVPAGHQPAPKRQANSDQPVDALLPALTPDDDVSF